MSGLGVVDGHGRLIGNLSARDVKQFIVKSPAVSQLQMPIAVFIKMLRQDSIAVCLYCIHVAAPFVPCCVMLSFVSYGVVFAANKRRCIQPLHVTAAVPSRTL